jgi:putative (di)nucleoside polyphosphate hydrolase
MPSSLPYRPAVGVMLLNRQGLVFVGKRIDQTIEGWQMPQGGIDKGEEPREAVMRELKEETGTDKARIIAEMPDWVTYDLPPHLVGIAFHGKYEPEFSSWKWLAIEELPQVIVPFKRDSYAKVLAALGHLARPE